MNVPDEVESSSVWLIFSISIARSFWILSDTVLKNIWVFFLIRTVFRLEIRSIAKTISLVIINWFHILSVRYTINLADSIGSIKLIIIPIIEPIISSIRLILISLP